MFTLKSYIKESIIDKPRPTLAKDVFDGEKLKPEVVAAIKSGINKIKTKADVLDYTLIGSIVTHRYRDDADIDVNVLVLTMDVGEFKELKDYASSISKKNLPGTEHPINFHVLPNKDDFDRANEIADGVFDVRDNKFIRKPDERPFDMDLYLAAFKRRVDKINELRDDIEHEIVTLEDLENVSKENLAAIRDRIWDSIMDDAIQLTSIYQDIKQKRWESFSRNLTRREIKIYGSHNALPDAVIYKLLETNCYLDFLQNIHKILDTYTEPKKIVKKVIDAVKG